MAMANKQHLAAVLYSKENLQLVTPMLNALMHQVNVPTHPPGTGEVQVHIHATGLCGSDCLYHHQSVL
jgi:D-arabinose 1-dehydrogenase-like Zn-dependent alcohol dehydrogenase